MPLLYRKYTYYFHFVKECYINLCKHIKTRKLEYIKMCFLFFHQLLYILLGGTQLFRTRELSLCFIYVERTNFT
jgi:hypothetical protein